MTINCLIKHEIGEWPLDLRALTLTKAERHKYKSLRVSQEELGNLDVQMYQ